MLYELATGRRPFQGKGVVDLGVAILTQPTPFAAEVEPTVPPALSAIIGARWPAPPRTVSSPRWRCGRRCGRLPVAVSESPTVSAAFPWDRTTLRAFGFASRPRWILALLALAVAIGGARSRTCAWSSLPRPRPSGPWWRCSPWPTWGARPSTSTSASASRMRWRPASRTCPRSPSSRARPPRNTNGTLPDTRRLARELGLSYVVSGSVQHAARRLRVTRAAHAPRRLGRLGARLRGPPGRPVPVATPGRRGPGSRHAPPRARPLLPAGADRPPAISKRSPTTRAGARCSSGSRWPATSRRRSRRSSGRSARDSGFALAHAGLGEALWARYQETQDASFTVKARDAAVEALRLDPERAATRYTLAVIYSGTGRPEQALEQLERVLSLHPGDDDASRLTGERARRARTVGGGRGGAAPGDRAPSRLLAQPRLAGPSLYRTGRHAQAIAAFRKVTELQPDSSRGFQMLGHGLPGRRPGGAGARELPAGPDARAGARRPSRTSACIRFGQGRFEDAARAWEEAARLEPRDPLKQRNLGDAYARLGRRGDASRAYDQAVALSREKLAVNPRDAASLSMLAVCEAKLGRRGEARRHAAAAVALAPDDADTLYESALVHVLAGELEPALSALERALERGYSRSLARRDEDLAPLKKAGRIPDAARRTLTPRSKGGRHDAVPEAHTGLPGRALAVRRRLPPGSGSRTTRPTKDAPSSSRSSATAGACCASAPTASAPRRAPRRSGRSATSAPTAIEPEVHDFEFEGSLEAGEPAGGAAERFALSGIFEPGTASRPVEAGGTAEIDLRIERDARPGRYRYQFRDLKAPAIRATPRSTSGRRSDECGALRCALRL